MLNGCHERTEAVPSVVFCSLIVGDSRVGRE